MELLPEQRWRSAAGKHLPFALVLALVGLGLLVGRALARVLHRLQVGSELLESPRVEPEVAPVEREPPFVQGHRAVCAE